MSEDAGYEAAIQTQDADQPKVGQTRRQIEDHDQVENLQSIKRRCTEREMVLNLREKLISGNLRTFDHKNDGYLSKLWLKNKIKADQSMGNNLSIKYSPNLQDKQGQ